MSLKCGIAGLGGRGHSWSTYLKLWGKRAPKPLKLVAVADISDSVLKNAESKLKVKTYKDYNDMLDDEKLELDLIIIAAPHYMHAPISIAAAEHGTNVLVEKPMCINLRQADEMRAAVEQAGIKLAVGFQERFAPAYTGLKNAVTSGDLGEIFQLNMIYHWWRTEEYYLNSTPVPENKDLDWEGWRGHWTTEGAGALANQMIHYMDIFQWLSPSPIKSVVANSRVSHHTFVETDDNTNAIVEFQNGSMGFIQAGVAYKYAKEEEYGIYGTEGALIRRRNVKGILGIPKFYDDRRKPGVKAKKNAMSYMPRPRMPTKSLLMNLVDAIVKDDASHISVDVMEGRKSVELMRAILLSQVRDTKITFPFDDSPEEFPSLLHTYQDKDLV
jgi:predicted dehydrogenase